MLHLKLTVYYTISFTCNIHRVSFTCNIHRASFTCNIHTVSFTCNVHTVSFTCNIHRVSLTCNIHRDSFTCNIHRVSFTCNIHRVSFTCNVHRVSFTCNIHTVSFTCNIHFLNSAYLIFNQFQSNKIWLFFCCWVYIGTLRYKERIVTDSNQGPIGTSDWQTWYNSGTLYYPIYPESTGLYDVLQINLIGWLFWAKRR